MHLIMPILSTDFDEIGGSKAGKMKVTQYIARKTQRMKNS